MPRFSCLVEFEYPEEGLTENWVTVTADHKDKAADAALELEYAVSVIDVQDAPAKSEI